MLNALKTPLKKGEEQRWKVRQASTDIRNNEQDLSLRKKSMVLIHILAGAAI